MESQNDTDKTTLDQFNALTAEDWSQILDINNRIQAYDGSWGAIKGGEKDETGVIQMPYAESASIVSEFMVLWYEKDLVINFDWSSWQEGRDWYANEDTTKYEKLDTVTALKLMTAVLRNDRFNDSALMRAFESGDFPKMLQRLVDIHEKGDA
jgi:hypothetical protein